MGEAALLLEGAAIRDATRADRVRHLSQGHATRVGVTCVTSALRIGISVWIGNSEVKKTYQETIG